MSDKFGTAIGQARGNVIFTPEYTETSAIMSLAGRESERIDRNAGKRHNVVQICPLNDDVSAWIGYREDWRSLTGVRCQRGAQNFHFFNAGFTVHVGRVGEVKKPQLLRSEWISHHDPGFTNQAGHPHWQLDALESVRTRSASTKARFNPERDTATREFGAAIQPVSEQDMILSLTVERMHFASAAMWWHSAAPSVVHGAESVDDLDRWVLGCLTYLRQELGRCVIIRER